MNFFLITVVTIFSVNTFAFEKISEPKVIQLVKVKGGQIAEVVSSVAFKAWSGGCTNREHFSLDIQITNFEQLVTVKRNVKDICEGTAALIDIEIQTNKLEVSDIAGKPIKIINPLAVDFSFKE